MRNDEINNVRFGTFNVAKNSSKTFNITAPLQMFMSAVSVETGLRGAFIINFNSSYTMSKTDVQSASNITITNDAVNHTMTVANASSGASTSLLCMYANGRITE